MKSKEAAKSTTLPLIRALVRSYQAFTSFDIKLLSKHDLTGAQADVIFTLGNTDGMTYKQIGQKTLTSKGTLTGIIERLIHKKIVQKCDNAEDARSQIVSLTSEGNNVFQTVFPQHIKKLENKLSEISEEDKKSIAKDLIKLTNAFQ